MPGTPEDIRAAMQGLTPAQQAQFMDELERRRAAAPAGSAALSQAEGISEQPAFGRNIKLRDILGPTMGDTELPISPAGLTDLIPGLAGLLGSIPGGPAGAAAGAGVGEAARMGIRKAAGYAPATGLVQELAGLDPNSPLTAALNVGLEAAGGGAAERFGSFLATKPGPLRDKSLKTYAEILVPKEGDRVTTQIAERLKPIADDLPVGFRGGIERKAEQATIKAGQKVREVYDNPTVEASFKNPAEKLRTEADKFVRTPESTHAEYDEFGQLLGYKTVDPDISDPASYRALQERVRDMQTATKKRDLAGGNITLADLFEQRKTESELARRAKASAFKPGLRDQPLSPKASAHVSARDAISDEMKALTGGSDIIYGPGGEITGGGKGAIADAVHSAWKTVEKGAKQTDPGTFISRWVLARSLPVGGTPAGAVAANPAFWRSIGSKGMRKLATAIEAGDDVGAEHLFRAAVDAYSQPKEQQ